VNGLHSLIGGGGWGGDHTRRTVAKGGEGLRGGNRVNGWAGGGERGPFLGYFLEKKTTVWTYFQQLPICLNRQFSFTFKCFITIALVAGGHT